MTQGDDWQPIFWWLALFGAIAVIVILAGKVA